MTIQQYRHLPSFAQVATIAYHGTHEESGNKSGPAILGNGIYLECNARPRNSTEDSSPSAGKIVNSQICTMIFMEESGFSQPEENTGCGILRSNKHYRFRMARQYKRSGSRR